MGREENEVTQSCPTLCNPIDCSLPGSSVHGIFQARILQWVATSFSNCRTVIKVERSSWLISGGRGEMICMPLFGSIMGALFQQYPPLQTCENSSCHARATIRETSPELWSFQNTFLLWNAQHTVYTAHPMQILSPFFLVVNVLGWSLFSFISK